MKGNVPSAIVAMSCMEVRALNLDYLEGDLGLDGYVRVDVHLSQCQHCSAIYDGIRNIVALVSADELFKLPDSFDKELYETLMGPGGA